MKTNFELLTDNKNKKIVHICREHRIETMTDVIKFNDKIHVFSLNCLNCIHFFTTTTKFCISFFLAEKTCEMLETS